MGEERRHRVRPDPGRGPHPGLREQPVQHPAPYVHEGLGEQCRTVRLYEDLAAAQHQRDVELVLQLADRLREGGLGDMTGMGGAGEVTLAGEGAGTRPARALREIAGRTDVAAALERLPEDRDVS